MNRHGDPPASSRKSRRTFLLDLGWIGTASLLAACAGPQQAPTRGAPTLVSTALPTAVPAGEPAARPEGTPLPPTLSPTTLARSTPATPPLAAKRDLVLLQGAGITTLDPHFSTFGTDINATFAIFDNLTFRNADQSVIRPMLATEWKVQDRRWELKLRPDVRFHNGDPLTSADVKFSIERTYDPAAKTVVATVFNTVERIETPDPLTVVFTTQQPDALLPGRLAFYGGQIIPKTYFERVGPNGFARRPIGTGPYTFLEWVKDDRLVLERFDGYWGGVASFERIVYQPRPDTPTRIAALLSGTAHLVTSVPTDQLEMVNRSGRARTDGALFNGLHVLAVNSEVPPLDRPLVKQALSLAIDRESIIKSIHRRQGVVPNGLIAQGDFGFDATLPPLEYNPDRARQRLQEAGYRGEEIVLETTQGYLSGDRQMAEAVDEMWRKVGIMSRLEVIDIAVRAEKTRDRTFKGLWWSDPVSTVLDPDGMMYRLLGPGGSQDYWHDAEWDRLGAQARSSLDQSLRLRNYRRMNEIALEHLPWIPVLQPRRLYGIANSIEFKPYGNGYVNLRRENLRPKG